ncbi:uncharacterized protein LOC136087804 isoform X2 [Hydra vulgaris]|uniref:Uncharacterized protein LOC136087804 isoform X2 n=1 Tax=Hydra vulgaris TaxID=6087 RepID=A0ABM4CZL0_HYDVU
MFNSKFIFKYQSVDRHFKFKMKALKVTGNDPFGNREFFSRLKTTLRDLYPEFKHEWEPLFRQISNNLRQQRWSKVNESSSKFLQLARGHNSLAIKDIGTLAEPVLSAELELKNELAKAVPSVAVLSILNRSLYHHLIYSIKFCIDFE